MADPSRDEAIISYMSFTNTSSISEARSALDRVNGNLEAAVEAYFDSNAGPTASVSNANQERPTGRLQATNSPKSNHPSDQIGSIPRRRRSFRAHESSQSGRSSPKLLAFFFRLWLSPLKLVAIPVSFVADLGLSFCSLFARLLGLRLPSSMSFHWLGSSLFGWTGPPQRTDPRTAAERWVRELEEELHARSSYTPAQPGDPTMPRLPEFLLLGYDDAVLKAKEEFKVLMVVLVSEEHDEIDRFKRGTLMNEELLDLIRDNNILVWGGDVKERDASLAANALDATTFPFVGFVSLQAQRPSGMAGATSSTSRSSSTNTMGICAKLEGSPYHTTSSRSIYTTINSIVLPRTTGHLNRLKTEKLQREADRRLREEQDRAYLEAGKKDRERVMKKKAELEAEQRKADELRLKALEKERLKNIKIEELEQKRRWRHWARKERMPVEPSSGGVVISFRLGNGRRVVRKFRADEPIKSLYLFVELESSHSSEEQPIDLPRPRPDYVHAFGFKLSTAMPRRILPLHERSGDSTSNELTISQFGELDGANVNVEGAFETESSSEEEEED